MRFEDESGLGPEEAAHVLVADDEAAVRTLLGGAVPEFVATSALADRALAGAVRHRRRTLLLGGGGTVAALAAAALIVGPMTGWGADGAPAGSVAAAVPGADQAQDVASIPQTKVEAVTRVDNLLHAKHLMSYMGLAASDSGPFVIYRKPIGDTSLESDAIMAAKPYSVVFRDSVLNASEQWVLGQSLYKDRDYWLKQGVEFQTALQNDGTITIFAKDPDKILPQLEKYYGYDGRVFQGRTL